VLQSQIIDPQMLRHFGNEHARSEPSVEVFQTPFDASRIPAEIERDKEDRTCAGPNNGCWSGKRAKAVFSRRNHYCSVTIASGLELQTCMPQSDDALSSPEQ
jgi:hypothetical protein